MTDAPRYRVVIASLITGRVRKVLIRDLGLSSAEAYRSTYGTTSSWRTGLRVERDPRPPKRR